MKQTFDWYPKTITECGQQNQAIEAIHDALDVHFHDIIGLSNDCDRGERDAMADELYDKLLSGLLELYFVIQKAANTTLPEEVDVLPILTRVSSFFAAELRKAFELEESDEGRKARHLRELAEDPNAWKGWRREA